MSHSGEKLGSKKQRAILALLSSRNIEEAAREARVTPRTLYRWMKERVFDAAYREAERAAFSQSISRLHKMAGAAVTVLGSVMVSANTPEGIKVKAADSILGHIFKHQQIEGGTCHSGLGSATETSKVDERNKNS